MDKMLNYRDCVRRVVAGHGSRLLQVPERVQPCVSLLLGPRERLLDAGNSRPTRTRPPIGLGIEPIGDMVFSQLGHCQESGPSERDERLQVPFVPAERLGLKPLLG